VQKRSVSESAADCRLHGSQETREQAAAAAQRGSVHTVKEAHGSPRQAAQCAWLLLARQHVGRFNKKAFKPQLDAIKDKYYEMFRNKSGKETSVYGLGFRV